MYLTRRGFVLVAPVYLVATVSLVAGIVLFGDAESLGETCEVRIEAAALLGGSCS